MLVAVLWLTSGLALLNCPFLVSAEHPVCCQEAAPKKCPLSSNFDTCPYIVLDGKIEHAKAKLLAVPPVVAATIETALPSSPVDGQHVSWTPSRTDLHIRIRVLLI